MPKTLDKPARPTARRWRSMHPFRPRLSRRRRIFMMVLFCFLSGIIGGYEYITDSNRVREKAEQYLSYILGGSVQVGSANLSIFEGLRLENVKVHVDKTPGADSVVFSADTFTIDYNPRAMLAGQLEAAQIIAIKPHVFLIQNVDTGGWNYQRMVREERPSATRPAPTGPQILPEIILRDAQVENGEIQYGIYHRVGSISAEGRLYSGGEPGRYSFTLQSRTSETGHLGPALSGWVVPTTGQMRLALHDFKFGPGIYSMLPSQVRQFWEQHKLAGVLNIPEISYTPPVDGGKPGFRVSTHVEDVTFIIRSDEWRSRGENDSIASIRSTMSLPLSVLPAAGTLRHLYRYTENRPLQLEHVKGDFLFTERGIDVQGFTGKIEQNAFEVKGHYDDYTPDAPAQIEFASAEGKDFDLPHNPLYVNSLPIEVQEIYNRFTPEGKSRFRFRLDRPTAGAKMRVTGEVKIINGQFAFDRFPYPLAKANGLIVIAHDQASGDDRVEIRNLTGQGRPGSVNANSHVNINGLITPLGPDAGVNIHVTGTGVVSEPALLAAMPREVRKPLKMFDAPRKGEYPKFSGDFTCDIVRLRGNREHWEVSTDLNLTKSSGRMVQFPYPMDDVTGLVKIREGYLDIYGAKMKRGNSTLEINGHVTWPPDDLPGEMHPDIRVTARNVPIDQDLLNALPEPRRKWIEKIGLSGAFDLDGKVFLNEKSEVAVDFQIGLHDGQLWPVAGMFSLSNLKGKAHLTSNQIELQEITAKRGDADLSTHGVVSWFEEKPAFELNANAKNLLLDSSLYKLLPPTAQLGWDQVHPQGHVDADLLYASSETDALTPSPTYSGERAGERGEPRPNSESAPTSNPSAPAVATNKFNLTLRPHGVSVTPAMLPYRLENLTGTATITTQEVLLDQITAKHGDGTLTMSGKGTLTEPAVWDLHVKGENISTDAEFLKALPSNLSSILDGLKMHGNIGFDFSKLLLRSSASATTAPATSTSGNDLDFATTITLDGASVQIGVPLTDVVGDVDIAGAIRGGALSDLTGGINIDSMKMAGRTATDCRATIQKVPEGPILRLGDIQATVANGTVAGEADFSFPDEGPSRFALALSVKDADVRELMDEKDPTISGRFAASLALEGNWSDPNSRRGRGDVLVAGKRMYNVPVLLGLLEMTNLALPLNSPFKEATARYSVQASKVTFENIDLRSDAMHMAGYGSLNFDDKKVKLTFTTDNPSWPKLPLFSNLVQGARNELFQIHINGTIQQPKITAGSFNTFTTTVDEVFNGSAASHR